MSTPTWQSLTQQQRIATLWALGSVESFEIDGEMVAIADILDSALALVVPGSEDCPHVFCATPLDLVMCLHAGNEPALVCMCAPGHTPESAECLVHGAQDCPKGEPLHYHHDGCPACDEDELTL